MLVNVQRMARIEAEALGRGIGADVLVEEVGARLARLVQQFFPSSGLLVCYGGKGHNAADILVAARLLRGEGWRVLVRTAWPPAQLAPLAAGKLAALGAPLLDAPFTPSPPLDGPLVLLDGLVGLGARGPLRGPLAPLAQEMNALRRGGMAHVIAMDIPSGLDGDTGAPGDHAVIADITATVGFPKAGLVADAAINHVGRLALLPVQEFSAPAGDTGDILTAALLAPLRAVRPFDTHKGQCGRIAIVAGERGLLGAGRLCSEAALRAGGGLVTLYASSSAYDLLAPAASPEVMVRPVDRLDAVLDDPCDVIAVGPGLGSGHDAEVLRIIEHAPQPVVIDADALNALARAGLAVLSRAKGPRLLTPHPGEMQRLLAAPVRDRAEAARDFVATHPCTLLLKGARTVIATPGQPLRYNTTGHPGMATAGMGDVLTGVCAALLGQRTGTFDAASLSAWICGRAAEIALITGGCSAESLTARDVLAHLGRAFDSLRRGDY